MLHPYQDPEFWANHDNESLRYVAKYCQYEEFKFKIVKCKGKRGYNIMLLKIKFDGNNYMTVFNPVAIGHTRTTNKAKNFISWFESMNDKNKDKYLSQFELIEHIPQHKQSVVITELVQNDKGVIRKVSSAFPKKHLRKEAGEKLDFDGIDRVKELIDMNHHMLRDTHLADTSVLRTSSKGMSVSRVLTPIKKVYIDTDRNLTRTK